MLACSATLKQLLAVSVVCSELTSSVNVSKLRSCNASCSHATTICVRFFSRPSLISSTPTPKTTTTTSITHLQGLPKTEERWDAQRAEWARFSRKQWSIARHGKAHLEMPCQYFILKRKKRTSSQKTNWMHPTLWRIKRLVEFSNSPMMSNFILGNSAKASDFINSLTLFWMKASVADVSSPWHVELAKPRIAE